jgi:hypothetical protein
MKSLFVNSKKIHQALKQDLHFSYLMPEEFTKDLRQYILTVVNSLTGGEFEVYVRKVNVTLMEVSEKQK